MANQGPERRQMLEIIALAAAASKFPGFRRWMFANATCAEHHGSDEALQPKPAQYKPQFFTPAEYSTIEQLTELIIPRDQTPGAKDVGVSEFIDFMVASDPSIQNAFRSGLQWLDTRSKNSYEETFTALSLDRQTEMLKALAYRAHFRPDDAEGQKFFRLVRRYTVMGYYTTRAGLEELNYPGLKLYSQSPACPHTADPEHRHLPPPIV